MAWESRSGNLYYYRKKRVGRRVVSEYIGAGPLADLAAMQDQHRAQEREEGGQPEENPELDALLGMLAKHAETVTSLYLQDLGYHQHKGQWRKKRNGSRD